MSDETTPISFATFKSIYLNSKKRTFIIKQINVKANSMKSNVLFGKSLGFGLVCIRETKHKLRLQQKFNKHLVWANISILYLNY